MIQYRYKINTTNKLDIYKLNKAMDKLLAYKNSGRENLTPEILLAEHKVLKEITPDILDITSKKVNISKSLKYFRKKYGNEGITSIVERFLSSKTYNKAHEWMANYTLNKILKYGEKEKI